MKLASQPDFYGGLYTHYRHHEGYAKRAQLFERFPEPILVVGCGFGYFVEELQRLGKNASGVDASKYAIENRVSDDIEQLNILDEIDVTLLKARNGKFATVISEDLLPCLTDDEAFTAAKHCAQLGGIVIHLVTEQGQAALNYHSTGYWMSLTGRITVSLEGM